MEDHDKLNDGGGEAKNEHKGSQNDLEVRSVTLKKRSKSLIFFRNIPSLCELVGAIEERKLVMTSPQKNIRLYQEEGQLSASAQFEEDLEVAMKKLEGLALQGVAIHFEKFNRKFLKNKSETKGEERKNKITTDEWKNESCVQPAPCEEDKFGYCHKEICPNLHKSCKFFYPKENITTTEDGNLPQTLKIGTFNVSYNVDVGRLAKYLVKAEPLDFVCIQEIQYFQIPRFLGFLRKHQCPWTYCARSPRSRSIILSTFPVVEVAKDCFSGNHEFVTVRALGVLLTCLHLNAREEIKRLLEIEQIKQQLEEAAVWGEAQIWAGDFNSVTREDYTDTEWAEIEEGRKKLHSKDSRYDDEPKVDVVAKMVELGFTDCWIETGRQGPLATCR